MYKAKLEFLKGGEFKQKNMYLGRQTMVMDIFWNNLNNACTKKYKFYFELSCILLNISFYVIYF